jgi:DNA-binding MarR family transcriptional regulator
MKTFDKDTKFPLGSALDFLQHLWELNHAMERVSLQMERTLGVTAQQRLFVRCLGKYPGMTASQLAAVLHLDRGTVSTSLRRLERKGLIAKRRDPKDNRRVALGLTSKGRAFDHPAPATVEHAVERLLAQLGRAQVDAVKGVLRQLAADLTAALPSR